MNTVGVRVPKSEIKSKVMKLFYDMWEKEFRDYNGARMGKGFYYGPDSAKAKYVIKLSREKLARFVRIISGHNSLFLFQTSN